MTSSANNLSLVQQENLRLWDIGIDSDLPAYVSGLLPGDIIADKRDAINVETTATLMIHSVFGSVLSETDVVRSEEGIFGNYARILVSRMEKGQDTGMCHPDVITMWNSLNRKDRGSVASSVVQSCDTLDSFPPVDNFNVAYSMESASIDMGETYIPVMIPAMVSVRSGLAVVIPSIRGATHYESAFNHLAYPHSTGVAQVHVWDVTAKRVSKISGEEFLDHVSQQKAKLLESQGHRK